MTNLSPKEEYIKNFISGGCHLGTKKITKQMRRYVFKVRPDGVALLDVSKMYEKIMVAARMIASVDPDSVISVSGKPAGQRAVYKFGHFTKTQTVTGRWSPGMLTNQTTKKFIEPRLLIVTDPRIDYNAILESSYVNLPVIALCNTDSNLKYVDCAIPCNNRSPRSVAMVWFLLTKAVLEIKKDTENFDNNPSAYVNVEMENKKQERGAKKRKGKKEGEEPEAEGEEEDKEGEEGEAEGEEEFSNKDEGEGGEEGEEQDDGDENFIDN